MFKKIIRITFLVFASIFLGVFLVLVIDQISPIYKGNQNFPKIREIYTQEFNEKIQTFSQKDMDMIIDKADKIIVYKNHRNEPKLYETTNRKDFDELKEAVKVIFPKKGEDTWYLACIGSPIIFLYLDDEEIAYIGNVGNSIKTSVWGIQLEVYDVKKYKSWFEKRGIELNNECMEK